MIFLAIFSLTLTTQDCRGSVYMYLNSIDLGAMIGSPKLTPGSHFTVAKSY